MILACLLVSAASETARPSLSPEVTPPSLHTCHFESTGPRGLASEGGSTLHHPVRPTSVEAAAHPGEIACFLCDSWSPSSPCRRCTLWYYVGKGGRPTRLFLPTARPPCVACRRPFFPSSPRRDRFSPSPSLPRAAFHSLPSTTPAAHEIV